MGWSKYAEDNYELFLERLYYRGETTYSTRFWELPLPEDTDEDEELTEPSKFSR